MSVVDSLRLMEMMKHARRTLAPLRVRLPSIPVAEDRSHVFWACVPSSWVDVFVGGLERERLSFCSFFIGIRSGPLAPVPKQIQSEYPQPFSKDSH
jgi:hypothetical protein